MYRYMYRYTEIDRHTHTHTRIYIYINPFFFNRLTRKPEGENEQDHRSVESHQPVDGQPRDHGLQERKQEREIL